MKRLNPAVKNVLVFFITGVLFLSCTMPGSNEYGTLVLTLPETTSFARAAVSSGFTATLTYRIVCAGPGGEKELEGLGGTVSIPLDAGNWTVTVTVLNAAGDPIGFKTVTTLIESGKATQLQVPVSIDTSRNDITSFAIISPAASGVINPAANTIAVSVPLGTSLTSLAFTLVHTGAAVSPAPGTPLNFSSPQTFTVTAENGGKKVYTVTVRFSEDSRIWPSTATWTRYGLSSALTQPSGTTVEFANAGDMLVVILSNADTTAFNSLINEIERITGKTGKSTSAFGGTAYGFDNFGGLISLTDWSSLDKASLIQDYPEIASITELPIPPGVPVVMLGMMVNNSTWPSNTTWRSYGLSSGLTQPPGTTVEFVNAGDMLSVILSNAGTTAFNSLINDIERITGKKGNSTSAFGGTAYGFDYDGGFIGLISVTDWSSLDKASLIQDFPEAAPIIDLQVTPGVPVVTLGIMAGGSGSNSNEASSDDSTTWPSASTWNKYDLAGLTQPSGTTVELAYTDGEEMGVILSNADTTAFERLISEIESMTGVRGTRYSGSGMSMYDLNYGPQLSLVMADWSLLSSLSPELSLIPGLSSIPPAVSVMVLSITPGFSVPSSGSDVWPTDSEWASFNLPGLTQPAGTKVATFYYGGTYGTTSLAVILTGVDSADYEDLYLQILGKFGSPSSTEGSSGASIRSAKFSQILSDGSEVFLQLSLDLSSSYSSDHNIAIYADKIAVNVPVPDTGTSVPVGG